MKNIKPTLPIDFLPRAEENSFVTQMWQHAIRRIQIKHLHESIVKYVGPIRIAASAEA